MTSSPVPFPFPVFWGPWRDKLTLPLPMREPFTKEICIPEQVRFSLSLQEGR